MADLWMILVPILITDLVNPVLFAFLVYAAGTHRPVVHSSAVLLGHTVAYLVSGIVLGLGLERITHRLANPNRIDFLIELIIGILLLWVAFRSGKGNSKIPQAPSSKLTLATAFGFGAIVNFVGLPFAVPYFAALDQILKADLSATDALVVLVVYNGLYALPFAIVPILCAALGEASRPLLERVRDCIDRASGIIMPVLLTLVGLALLADAISFFATNEPLF